MHIQRSVMVRRAWVVELVTIMLPLGYAVVVTVELDDIQVFLEELLVVPVRRMLRSGARPADPVVQPALETGCAPL